MIRLLAFIVWVAFFAAAASLLLSLNGVVSAEIFGWRMDIPAGAAAAIVLALIALTVVATTLIKDLAGLPRAARKRKRLARREKGVAAFLKAQEGLAAGDADTARKYARLAKKLLGDVPAAKIVAAQAALLDGDIPASDLSGLLDAPETELLALRALYDIALREGEQSAARAHVERALLHHPKTRWALDAQIDLALDRCDFRAARDAFFAASNAKTIDSAAASRGAAAATAAAAYSAHAAGDAAAGLAEAGAALKLAPGLAPAAILSARLHAGKGETKKAEKILNEAFAITPDYALCEEIERLTAGEPAAARAEKLDRLASAQRDARESQLAHARALMLRGDAAGAVAALRDVLKSSATACPLLMMAEAQERLSGDAAERPYLLLAAAAPRGAALTAESYSLLSGKGWRALIREYRDHGRYAPPPLEAAPGLSDHEFPNAAPAPLEFQAVEPLPMEAAADNTLTEEMLDREAAAARGVS